MRLSEFDVQLPRTELQQRPAPAPPYKQGTDVRGQRADLASLFVAELHWLTAACALSAGCAEILARRIAISAATSSFNNTDEAFVVGGAHPAQCLDAPFRNGVGLSAAEQSILHDIEPLARSTDALLASGGDDRLTLDPSTGLNRYHCSPRPRVGLISFGSCTASSPGPGAYAAADQGRRAMLREALASGYTAAIQSATRDVENQILAIFDAADCASAVLTASGTDAALVITALLAADHPGTSFTSIVVSPAETGSGVPLAVQGCHFAAMTPSGMSVAKGERVEGLGPTRLVTLPIRDPAGRPLTDGQVAAACDRAIADSLPHGRVTLHAIDGSKTGLTAPGYGALKRLSRQYGERLDIVIDACQARVEPALIRAYLDQGFPVLVTGSKFFGAPGFCGAVLLPHSRFGTTPHSKSLPTAMGDYAGQASGIGSRQCPGLLLRWTAALHDMARFAQLSNREIGRRLDDLGSGIIKALAKDTRLTVVAAPRPPGMGWSDRRSVFTFTVEGREGLLDQQALRQLYGALQTDMSAGDAGHVDAGLAATLCQLGQPVQLGDSGVGGLRIAISAAQLVDAEDQTARLAAVVAKLGLLLDCHAHGGAAAPR